MATNFVRLYCYIYMHGPLIARSQIIYIDSYIPALYIGVSIEVHAC